MTATPVMSIADAKLALDAITATVNTGGTGSLFIRSGSPPATTLTADSGTLGATLGMSATAFPASTSATSNGLATATANAISSETNAPASITAGYFRIKNGSSVVVLQGTCGTSSADMIFNTVVITIGDTIACTSFKVTLACGDGVS